jgi:hypothetical protein
MKIAKLLLCLGTAALAVATAGTRYFVHLSQTVMVSGTELQPGDYRMELVGDKAMIKGAKSAVEAPVKMEEGDSKFPDTTVRYTTADGKYKLSEIRLGGTKTKVVFN